MEFVKKGVYQQEFTKTGIRDLEVDTRPEEEIQKELNLKKLPEFSRDWGRLSLAEIEPETQSAPPPQDDDTNKDQQYCVPASVTQEEYDFLKNIDSERKRKKDEQRREEEEMVETFRKEVKKQVRPLKDEKSQLTLPKSMHQLKKPTSIGAVFVKKKKVLPADENSNRPPNEGCAFAKQNDDTSSVTGVVDEDLNKEPLK